MAFLIGIILLAVGGFASLYNLDLEDEVIISTSSNAFVEISSNPSTGYMWYILDPQSDALSVTNLEGVYNPPPPGSQIGVSGKQVFELVCNSKCAHGQMVHLTIIKKRSWENSAVESRTFLVRVLNE